MSGGSKTQTQTTTQQPYAAAKPLLDQGMGDALKQYQNGGLVKPNTMSTVVPYANQTMQGMNAIQSGAQANMGGQGLSGQYQNVINSGGYTGAQQQAMGNLNPFASGQNNTSSAQANLSGVAAGNNLGGGNPYFEQALQTASDKTMDSVNRQAAGMGRYGSGAHSGVAAREIGNLQTQARANQHNQERNYQMQANQMLDAARSDNLNRQMGAIGQQFNAGQTALGNLGTAYQGSMAPADALMGVGGMYEDLMGRQMNDRLRIANEQQNLPLANIQALLAAGSGAGGYGTGTTTAQMPNNTASNIAGGLLGGASLLGGLFR